MDFAPALSSAVARLKAPLKPNFWLQQVLRAPRATGAILPSGQSLATEMTVNLPDGLVVELGPGTGVITRALLRHRKHPQDLIAIEFNPHFAAALATEFPSVDILTGRAEQMSALIDMPPYSVAAVVSGLPLRNMSAATHYRILSGAFRLLRTDGVFVQFTYGPVCPVAPAVLYRLGLVAHKTAMIWRNVPPASVWHITRG